MARKYISQFLFFIGFLLFLFGCKKQDNACLNYTQAPVIEVKGADTALVNQEIDLTASFVVFNGCGQFGSFEESTSGNTTIIILNAKYKGCVCTQVLLTKTGIYKFKKQQKGTYELKFLQEGDSFLTHTIVVQ